MPWSIHKGWLYLGAGLALLASHIFAYNWGVKHQGTEGELAAALTSTQAASQALGTVVAKATDNAARGERRDNLRQGADDEYTDRIRTLEADRSGLAAELDRLRASARAAGQRTRGACTQGQAAEQGGQAESALEIVFGQCTSRYAEVAGDADAAVAAGLKCEGEHAADETLTAEVPQ